MKKLFMKKLLLGFVLLFSLSIFSQTQYIKNENGLLSFNYENGQGIDQVYNFKVEPFVIDSLRNKKCFLEWKNAMDTELTSYGISKLKDIQKDLPKTDLVLIYIRQQIIIQNLLAKYKYKNPNSFKIVENSKGSIGFSEKGELLIYQHCSAKNGYGNDIPATIFYVLNFETCKFTTL